jgi:hypothetical protein
MEQRRREGGAKVNLSSQAGRFTSTCHHSRFRILNRAY